MLSLRLSGSLLVAFRELALILVALNKSCKLRNSGGPGQEGLAQLLEVREHLTSAQHKADPVDKTIAAFMHS